MVESDGYIGVKYCDKLFAIEKKIADMANDAKVNMRIEKSKPVLEEFFEWGNLSSQKIILNSKLQKAITYAKNQRKELSEFLNDGNIPLTNSLAERSVRPFAVHRKNWLLADSVDGAKASAVIYSLVESAKQNNLNVEEYFKYLLTELPQIEDLCSNTGLHRYLPWSKELSKKVLNAPTEEAVPTNIINDEIIYSTIK